MLEEVLVFDVRRVDESAEEDVVSETDVLGSAVLGDSVELVYPENE